MIDPLKLLHEDKLIYFMFMQPQKCFHEIASKINSTVLERSINRGILKRCIDNPNKIGLEGLNLPQDANILLYMSELTGAFGHINVDNINIRLLMESIFERYKSRRLKEINIETGKMLSQGKSNSEVMEYIETEKSKLNLDLSTGIISIAEILDMWGSEEALKELDSALFKTGFHKFDNMLKFKKGDLIYLAGQTSMGKTDFALIGLAKNLAKKGIGVGIISLEMREEYLMKRLLDCTSANELAKLPIFIDQSRSHNINSLIAKAKKMIKDYNIQILIVDYLTLIDPPRAENRHQEVSKISRQLKLSANELQIPFLVLSQLNREVAKRKNKKPVLSDLRESGSIEQDADAVIFLYRPFAYKITRIDEVNDTTNYLEVGIAKNRDGRVGMIPFFYNQEKKIISEYMMPGEELTYKQYINQPEETDVPF